MVTEKENQHSPAERHRESAKSSSMVSVIIPCYNYGEFLEESIESALHQTYGNTEIIVVNDGSSDETEEVCRHYEGQIQYVLQQHQGVVRAINTGIELSRGDFLYFLSSDDKLFPEAIDKQMKIMRQEEDCALVCGNAKLIDDKGCEIGESIIPLPERNLLLRMLEAPNLHDGTLLFRRAILEKIDGLYFKEFENYHGYHHRCFQLARHHRLRYINDFLVYQRVHPRNLSHPKNLEKMIEGYEVIRSKMRFWVQPWELFAGINPKDREEMAQAYHKTGVLFFYFGQYDIAHADLKHAVTLHGDIWSAEDRFPTIVQSRYLYPFKPFEPICRDEVLLKRTEQKKGTYVQHILTNLQQGEIVKAFYLCREAMNDNPQCNDIRFLLSLVYLHQMQIHDSVNRYHKVTRSLLEEIHRNNPFHSIDLYLWLAFLDEGKRHDYLRELHSRFEFLNWFDLNETLWLTQNVVLTGKKDLLDEIRWVFKKSGWGLNDGTKQVDGGCDTSVEKQNSGKVEGKPPIGPAPRGKKLRILLISPPYARFLGLGNCRFPLSFGALGTILAINGHTVAIYDADFDKDLIGKADTYEYTFSNQHRVQGALADKGHFVWREIERQVRSFHPDVIGITTMTNKYPMALRIAEMSKSINPDIQVVVGGHHASMFGPKLIQDRNIDFAVIGEGELTFLELINRLCDPRPDFSHVMGLIYKNGGRISSNGPRELLCNLDVLPIADRDLMTNEGFVSENNVMASRGCPFHCSYCGAQVIWKRKVRRRSVSHVVREIEYLFQRGSSRIVNFWDDSFTSDRRYTADLMTAFKKFDGLNFSCITRLDLVDPQTLAQLKEAGCSFILFGIESGSDEILQQIDKKMTRALIRQQTALVNAAGIPWLGFFIMGYPGEKREQIHETLAFMKELNPNYAEINIFNPLPGTRIWADLENKGLVGSDMDFSRYSQASTDNYFPNESMSQQEFRELALFMAKEFDAHNRSRNGNESVRL